MVSHESSDQVACLAPHTLASRSIAVVGETEIIGPEITHLSKQ